MKKRSSILLLAGVILASRGPLQSLEASSFDPFGVKLIHTGETIGVLVTNNNHVFTYGYSFFGNRGDGNSAQGRQTILSNITTSGDLANRASDDDIIDVQTGSFTLTVLTESGKLYYSGKNDTGASGNGTTSDLLVPTLISNKGELANLSNTDKIVDYTLNSGNRTQIHVLTQEGRIFGWGENGTNGSVGNGTTTPVITSPVEITTSGALNTLEANETIIDLLNGYNVVFALSSTGRLFGWGTNAVSGGYNFPYLPTPQASYVSPIEIPLNEGVFATFDADEKIIEMYQNLSTGTLFRTNKDRLVYSGNANFGKSGNGTSINSVIPSFDVTTQDLFNNLLPGEKIKAIDAIDNGFLVLTTKDRLIGWGANNFGQLGLGENTSHILMPTLVANTGVLTLDQSDPIRLFSGHSNTMVITQSGKMVVWGSNSSGGRYFSLIDVNDPTSFTATSSNSPIDITFAYQAKVLDVLTTDLNRINAMIANLIPVNALTLDSEEDVAYIRDFYENLSNEDKAGVIDLATLVQAEAQIALLIQQRNDAVQPVITQINALPTIDTITLNDKLAVEAARSAFDALPDNYQDYVTNQSTLFALELKIQELEDAARVQAVQDAIEDLLNNPSVNPYDQRTRIEAIEALYNELSDSNKANVNNYATFTEEKTSTLASIASIEAVLAAINVLPELNALSLDDLAVVQNARTLYDALTLDEQALITNYQDLLDAEARLALLNQQAIDQAAADAVKALINALPSVNDLSLEDEEQVEAARDAYDALTADQQALVNNYQTQLDVEAQLALLRQQAIDQAAAEEVIALINALPSVDDLTKTDADAVQAARAAYSALSSDQQALVTNEPTLVLIEARLAELNAVTPGLSLLQWVLILIMLFAIASFLYWFITDKQKQPTVIVAPATNQVEVRPQPVQEETPSVKKIELGDVVLNRDIKTAPQFTAFSQVAPGSYLEITPDFASTNRVVEVSDTLPKVLNETNRFIALSPEEVKTVKLSIASGAAFVKKTPGSYIDEEGYYVEVDLQNQIVDNYIFAKTRLAPTTTKGHRWIRIETRKIYSK